MFFKKGINSMISKETIEEVKNRLVKTYNPLAIYLFGSYAWGSPTEDSDLDLLVVVDTSDEKSFKRPREGHKALIGLCIGKDLLVFTRAEFEEEVKHCTSLVYKVKKYGKALYVRA